MIIKIFSWNKDFLKPNYLAVTVSANISETWVSSGGLFSVRTPPTPPNHQLQWTPPTCILNLQLQWTPMGISLYSFQICNSNGLQWTPMGISSYVDLVAQSENRDSNPVR